MNFDSLNLIPQILKAVSKVGYETPSPIQQQAIPPILQGRDLLGCAQTGTGKTAAFAMPILQRLMQQRPAGRVIRSLILTPTRELALQIQESFQSYGQFLPLKSCVIFGGVSQNPQVDAIKRGVDILVATPGRLNDLINQGFIKLSDIEIFVLDEADRMLDMGFVHDVKRILKYIPQKRQTLLFSATMPKEIEELAASLLDNPVEVYVTPPSTTVELIEQSLYKVDKLNKRPLLAMLLKYNNIPNALVFTRTKHGADRVVRELDKEGIKAVAIHGNKSQNARQTALNDFKNKAVRVLVATDIAARGIDITDLSHVINYDLPEVPETYVHRIGRTGRAGQNGIAISFCNYDELPMLADIEKLIKLRIPEVTTHQWPMQIFEATKKQPQQPRPPRTEKGDSRRQAPKKKQEQQKPSFEARDEKAHKTRRGGKNHKPKAPAQQEQPFKKPQQQAAQKPQTAKPSAAAQKAQPSHKLQKELQVVNKKAVKQKFASFDDYINSNN